MNVRFLSRRARAGATLRLTAPMLAFAAALLGASPLASAQDPDDLHLSGFLGLGFGGELDFDPGEFDLDATVGFGLRLDVPLHEFFTVGGQVGFLFPKLEDLDERQTWIDLPDLVLRGRYPVRVGSGLLEPYVGFLIGGTISHFSSDQLDVENTAYGWNVGLLFGAQYFFSDVIGVLAELGWHRHGATHTLESALGDLEDTYSANQFALNLGISVLF